MEKPICVAHVVENLEETFGIRVSGNPFLIHINLSNNQGSIFFFAVTKKIPIADLRFNVNAAKYEKKDAAKHVEELKKEVRKKPKLKWNNDWEKEAIELFLEQYRAKLNSVDIAPVRLSEPINGKNRLTKAGKISKICQRLAGMDFEWLKDVRGDGNCYYRSIVYGYMELLLTGDISLLKGYIELYAAFLLFYRVQKKPKKKKDWRILEKMKNCTFLLNLKKKPPEKKCSQC